jgi:cytosine/uracil/thiamine/allantoin permease
MLETRHASLNSSHSRCAAPEASWGWAGDLGVTPREGRTWTSLHYVLLWCAMILSVSNYLIASSIIQVRTG